MNPRSFVVAAFTALSLAMLSVSTGCAVPGEGEADQAQVGEETGSSSAAITATLAPSALARACAAQGHVYDAASNTCTQACAEGYGAQTEASRAYEPYDPGNVRCLRLTTWKKACADNRFVWDASKNVCKNECAVPYTLQGDDCRSQAELAEQACADAYKVWSKGTATCLDVCLGGAASTMRLGAKISCGKPAQAETFSSCSQKDGVWKNGVCILADTTTCAWGTHPTVGGGCAKDASPSDEGLTLPCEAIAGSCPLTVGQIRDGFRPL